MAAETVIESFCERCGTRYTFEPARKRGLTLSGLGRTLGILAEEAPTPAARDPFHGTFHFCLECRQYTCPDCWNEIAGFCQGCVPYPDTADLYAAEAAATMEATSAAETAWQELQVLSSPEAWPGVDLIRQPLEDEAALPPAADREPAATVPPPVPLQWESPPGTVALPEPAWADDSAGPAVDATPGPDDERTMTVVEEPPFELIFEPETPTWNTEPEHVAEPPAEALTDITAYEATPAGPAPDAAAIPEPEVEVVGLLAGGTEVAAEPDLEVEVQVETEAEIAQVEAEVALELEDESAIESEALPEGQDEAHPEVELRAEGDLEPGPAFVSEAALVLAAHEAETEAVSLPEAESSGEAAESRSEGTIEAGPEVAQVEPEAAQVEAEAEVAQVEAEAEVAQVEAEAEVAQVEAEAEVAQVEAEAEVAQVEAGPEAAQGTIVGAAAAAHPAAMAAPPSADTEVEASWAALLEHAAVEPEPSPDGELVPEDWAVLAPALGPDVSPDVPVAQPGPPRPTPSQPTPTPSLAPIPTPTPPVAAPAWQLTAPETPPQAGPGAWPPAGPVYRSPSSTPPPQQPAVAPHPSILAPLAPRPAGSAAQMAAVRGSASAMPTGVRPCGNCALPLSAAARFCRRCGRPQG